jgi:hypothetical protein
VCRAGTDFGALVNRTAAARLDFAYSEFATPSVKVPANPATIPHLIHRFGRLARLKGRDQETGSKCNVALALRKRQQPNCQLGFWRQTRPCSCSGLMLQGRCCSFHRFLCASVHKGRANHLATAKRKSNASHLRQGCSSNKRSKNLLIAATLGHLCPTDRIIGQGGDLMKAYGDGTN